ncbi:MAG: hypothetical protein JOZ46_12505 [Candidatus Dormibacteraeota bacterium]|nr:hypothetical protein [Candidatus Dormibacteraeota bacterium]MBV9526622.1 hypothetical protein [Candidatus Dormibacteraeota bacterium]
MLPPSYVSFFSVSTQVSAALIGLLFVSVSIEAESVFGERATLRRQLTALSAFTALVNTFFLSLTSIIPSSSPGPAAVALGVLAVNGTAADALTALRLRKQERRTVTLLLIVISMALYAYETALGVKLILHPHDIGTVDDLLTVVIAAYAIGLSRAWQLLGGRRGHSLLRQIRAALRGRTAPGDDDGAT